MKISSAFNLKALFHFSSPSQESWIGPSDPASECVHVIMCMLLMPMTLYSPGVIEWLAAYKAYSPCKSLTEHGIRAEYPLLFIHIWLGQPLPSWISAKDKETEQNGTERMCRHWRRRLWRHIIALPSPLGTIVPSCFSLSAIPIILVVKHLPLTKTQEDKTTT